ncbi:MAG: phospho-N-acetylmuramoyl-pentapeptide-transferase, partial [Geobacteraceae bacterium GWB2_52_12]
MLYHIFYPLASDVKLFNIFKYLTFRTIYSMITALLVCFVIGPWIIRKLESLQARQVIRTDGPESHLQKQGTPTMGGVMILAAIVIPTLLWADLKNSYIWLTLFITVGYGIIGFVDDYKKVVEKNPKGLSPRQKMFWQVLLAGAVAVYLFITPGFSEQLFFPFFKNFHPDLWIWFIPFAILVVVGASNAVNLTDGLDGLAIGPVAINAATYMLFAYVAGHATLSAYLQVPRVVGAGELAVVCGAMVGAGLGFLWYNSYPAEVFMGDVGSLSLGGTLGIIAVLTKQEILLVIVGGVFVVEALS